VAAEFAYNPLSGDVSIEGCGIRSHASGVGVVTMLQRFAVERGGVETAGVVQLPERRRERRRRFRRIEGRDQATMRAEWFETLDWRRARGHPGAGAAVTRDRQ